jgi:hypothetical protein
VLNKYNGNLILSLNKTDRRLTNYITRRTRRILLKNKEKREVIIKRKNKLLVKHKKKKLRNLNW